MVDFSVTGCEKIGERAAEGTHQKPYSWPPPPAMKYQLISSLEQTVEASTYYRYLPKPKPPRKTTLGVHVFIVLLVLIHSLFLLW